MEGLFVISGLAALCLLVCGSVFDETVQPGDNITIKCDCTCGTGVYTVWHRISQQNQPTLVIRHIRHRPETWENPHPRLELVKNHKSDCYDLHIINITESDEGLYFCGTETIKVMEIVKIGSRREYTFGNATTRILLKSREPADTSPMVCWTLLYSLCPALTVLSTLLIVFLLYSECQKQGAKSADTSVQMSQNEDEDVCYAALEIRQASQRPRRKKTTEDSDFLTYSAVKTNER